MKIIGLCGKSGSGKGTVAALLRDRGIPVLDTDKLYHSLINDPRSDCTKAIADTFGTIVLDEEGRVSRAVLRQIVFGEENKEKWRALNAISHHYVQIECKKWIEKQRQNAANVVCLDVPLLFESHLDKICHITLAVLAPINVCVSRIIERDGIDSQSAAARLSAQLQDEELASLCQFTITNDGSIDRLSAQVQLFLSQIQNMQ